MSRDASPALCGRRNSQIRFYTWGDRECCLEGRDARDPARSAVARRARHGVAPAEDAPQGYEEPASEGARTDSICRPAMCSIFEEVLGPTTGDAPTPTRRIATPCA